MSIPFIEFVRPNGRKVERALDSDDVTEAMAQDLIDAGCRFTAELIPEVNMVSITAENDREDIAFRLFRNSPGRLAEETVLLVRSAHAIVVGDS